ncbi:MAG: 50S ribosomal protein L29 [Nanoarchaeota archaeon]|nr:50S ribosomal protein L29 [Nanoarchaeota archaeon]|tara:strand:+ start:3955 stop:4158 length:204 start_codon:yes stop_codon:yes gene_type:complete
MSKAMKELLGLQDEELVARLQELRKELMKENNLVASASSPSSPGKLRQMKKNIARIKTLQRQKEVHQ